MIPCKIKVVSDLQLAINPWRVLDIPSRSVVAGFSELLAWVVRQDIGESIWFLT